MLSPNIHIYIIIYYIYLVIYHYYLSYVLMPLAPTTPPITTNHSDQFQIEMERGTPYRLIQKLFWTLIKLWNGAIRYATYF